MTDDQPPPPDVTASVRHAYDDAVRAVAAWPDALQAYEAAAQLLDLLEKLEEQARWVRDAQVLRVKEDRALSLADLAKTLRWGVSRIRMHQVVDRARAARDAKADPPPAA